jgi:cytochrome oxidase Cu insertion factor (SCO1/SenC/PrrC family)
MRRRTAVFLGVVLAAALGAGAQDRIAPLRVHAGEPAPDFALPAAGGGQLRLASLRGHAVLLDFYRGYW